MRSIALLATLLLGSLAAPLPARAGMGDCVERGGIGVHDGKCYRVRTRNDRD